MEDSTITVTIPYEEFFSEFKYIDRKNCYLASALKNAGYKDVTVHGWGSTIIDGEHYHPTKNFDMGVVQEAFNNKQDLVVTLVKEQ